MTKLGKKLPLWATSSLLVLALSGCGGDDSSGTDTSITLPGTSTPTPSPTPSPTPTPTGVTTASVDCPYSGSYMGDYSAAGMLTATWSWACSSTVRSLTANGLPDHAVGTFPNPGNPNTISAQTVSGSMTLTPTLGTANIQIGGPGGASAFARNGVKFDPGTGGSCASSITATSQCNLGGGVDQWRIEALGQDIFDFGEDMNNAHVQPGGIYHYHGMPEGILTNAGASDSNKKMVLIGWAGDGYPIYGRFCYSDAMDATTALKVCTGSFAKDTVADSGRPSTALVPLGAFLSDWTYSAGSGDLDDCNGRTGVTPEFPNGIYYYMATDSYPYMSRCLKGNIN
ncbi:YHYH protein [Parasphingorhabdus sp.]|uniref:YHYH protein n=1 Tax=Parasphingorhabdus sp. TaxID=2709688 RepID=UPI003C728599